MNVVCMGLDLLKADLKERLEREERRMQETIPEDDLADQNTEYDGNAATCIDYWFGLTQEILENSQNAVSVLNDLLSESAKTQSMDLSRTRNAHTCHFLSHLQRLRQH